MERRTCHASANTEPSSRHLATRDEKCLGSGEGVFPLWGPCSGGQGHTHHMVVAKRGESFALGQGHTRAARARIGTSSHPIARMTRALSRRASLCQARFISPSPLVLVLAVSIAAPQRHRRRRHRHRRQRLRAHLLKATAPMAAGMAARGPRRRTSAVSMPLIREGVSLSNRQQIVPMAAIVLWGFTIINTTSTTPAEAPRLAMRITPCSAARKRTIRRRRQSRR